MAITTKRTSMVSTVLDWLQGGREISALDAAMMWGELNLRNKISVLRADGWPITSREEMSKNGRKYKVYFLDGEKFDAKSL